MQKIKQEQRVHFDPDILDVVLRMQASFAKVYAENAD